MYRWITISALLLSLLFQFDLRAQLAEIPAYSNTHTIAVNFTVEPHVTTTLSYQYKMRNNNIIGVAYKRPLLIMKDNDYKISLIVGRAFNIREDYAVYFFAMPYIAHAKNRAGSMTGIGTELRLLTMSTAKRWHRGFDIGYQTTFLNYINHSSASKENFKERYPNANGPVDGWYLSSVHRFRFGYSMIIPLQYKLHLQIDGGVIVNLQKQGIIFSFPFAQIPFYLGSTLRYFPGQQSPR